MKQCSGDEFIKMLKSKNLESINADVCNHCRPTNRGACESLGAAVSVLGLEHHKADHDGDKTYWGYHQGKDDGRWRVAQLLRGAVHEELLVDFHKPPLHQWVGPWDLQAVRYLLRAVAQVTVKAAEAKKKKQRITKDSKRFS